MKLEQITDEIIRIQRTRAALSLLQFGGGVVFGVVMFIAGYVVHG